MFKQLISGVAIFLVCSGILHAQELSTSVVREGYKMWEPMLDTATQIATQQLNRVHNLHLDKVSVENTKVAAGVMYYLGLEFDIGSSIGQRYDLAFLHPSSEWRPLWNTLPSSPSYETYTSTTTPPSSTALSLLHEIQQQQQHPYHPSLSLTLRGPLEVYLGDPSTEVHIRAPREVDIGMDINKILLEDGVNMTVSGFHELQLREPVVISAVDIEENKLKVGVRSTPKVALIGGRVNIVNASTEEALKVRRSGRSEIALLSASGEPPVRASTPFEIPLDDSRLQTIQSALQQLQTGANAAKSIALRRLVSSKFEAVTSFFLPVVASSADGVKEDWEVVVVQGNNHKAGRVVSMHKKSSHNEVSFERGLAVNGTLNAALERFVASRPEYTLNSHNL